VDLTVVVREQAGGYWSQVRELPGCFASGRTLNELRKALREAIGLYMWDRPIEPLDDELRVGEIEIEVEQQPSSF
jgi:predicted RNase H-like HicB family nuclease